MSALSPKDSIAAFAEVQAALSDPFGDRDVTLALRGFDERAWQSIEAAWTARLARNDDEAIELAKAYGEAFEAARRAPGKGREPKKTPTDAPSAAPPLLAPEPPAPALEISAPGASEPASVPVAPRPVMTPSFLKDRPPAAPPPAPSPVAIPTSGYTGTAAVDLAAMFKSAVPFDPSVTKSEEASPGPPARLSKSALSGETADVDIGAIARQVLAFGGARPEPKAASPNVPVANNPQPPSPANNRQPPSPANPTFTLDQYAQLSAEIAFDANPAARAAVFARWSVRSPDALTAEWRARFAADPALAGRWSAAYAHHYARLQSERSSRR